MAVPTTRAAFKEYCLRRLGKPVIEINVDDDQVEDDKNALKLGDDMIGIRFTNITIPQGATIISSYIEFVARSNKSNTTSTTIYAQDIDDAPAIIETDFNLSSRAATGLDRRRL